MSVTAAGPTPAAEAGGHSPGSVLVRALVRHRYDGVRQPEGAEYPMAAPRVAPNVALGLVAVVAPAPITPAGAPPSSQPPAPVTASRPRRPRSA